MLSEEIQIEVVICLAVGESEVQVWYIFISDVGMKRIFG